jgi:hypothetical protein
MERLMDDYTGFYVDYVDSILDTVYESAFLQRYNGDGWGSGFGYINSPYGGVGDGMPGWGDGMPGWGDGDGYNLEEGSSQSADYFRWRD